MNTFSAGKPLGIDLGSSCIKAVQMKKSGRNARIVEIYTYDNEREVPGHPSIEVIGKSVKDIASEHRLRSDLFASAFPLSLTIVRNTVVPFRGRKKLRQVIKFQAEPHIPFPIEEVIVDFYEISGDEGEKTPLILVGAKKDLVGTHLEILGQGGIDPEIVSVDAFALANNYLTRAGNSPASAAVLLDMGATKTLLVLMRGSSILLTRSLNIGGDHLTEALQKELRIDFHAAEALKKEKGTAAPGENLTTEEENIHRALKPVLRRLNREVDRSIRSVSAALRGERLEKIHLSGGGTLLNGMKELFAQEFNCEADYLCNLSPFAGSADLETMCRMGIATGLALQGLGLGGTEINLRQEEFTHTRSFIKVKRQIIISSIIGVCIIGFLIFDFGSGFVEKRSDYLSLKARLEQTYKETFPGGKGMQASLIIPTMRKKLNSYETEYNSFSVLSEKSISSLEILMEISALMPKEIKSQITDLSIDQDEVELEGLINNPGDADKVILSLQKSPYFSKINVSSTSHEGKKYKFKLVGIIKK